jgi:hypothetical protein
MTNTVLVSLIGPALISPEFVVLEISRSASLAFKHTL